MKEVKIVFIPYDYAKKLKETEDALAKLVNNDWIIVAGGGYGYTDFGFVLLQRERPSPS